MKKIVVAMLLAVSLLLTGCAKQDDGSKKIVFGDKSWDSIKVHNRIMAFIIENGYEGYEIDYIAGDTIPVVNGVMQGDIDVDMESWHSNFRELYDKAIKQGKLIDLGKNLPDAPQGWYVPRYLVEGDDALAPDLKSVKDLAKYPELFTDPEDKTKGLIYGGCAGWGQLPISQKIFDDAGLEDKFNFGIAGSGTALAGTMVGQYKKEQGWVGYYWAPTAILGKLDMVMLEGSRYEPADVNILISEEMEEKAPEIVEVLKKYSTTVAQNNKFLALMEDNEWSYEETAKWFLTTYKDLWKSWVPADVATKVESAL